MNTKLPTSIGQAVEAASNDTGLEAALPEGMLKHYLVMKDAEQEMLSSMGKEERRVWLMERY